MHNVRTGEYIIDWMIWPYSAKSTLTEREVITMVKQIKISNFNEVKNIMNAASRCCNEIGVHDAKGSIADAKSILGLMSLDYTHPVLLVSEDEEELERVYKALN